MVDAKKYIAGVYCTCIIYFVSVNMQLLQFKKRLER